MAHITRMKSCWVKLVRLVGHGGFSDGLVLWLSPLSDILEAHVLETDVFRQVGPAGEERSAESAPVPLRSMMDHFDVSDKVGL